MPAAGPGGRRGAARLPRAQPHRARTEAPSVYGRGGVARARSCTAAAAQPPMPRRPAKPANIPARRRRAHRDEHAWWQPEVPRPRDVVVRRRRFVVHVASGVPACGGRNPPPRAGTASPVRAPRASLSSPRPARHLRPARAGTASADPSARAAPSAGRGDACSRPARSPRATRDREPGPVHAGATGGHAEAVTPRAGARAPRRAPRAGRRRRAPPGARPRRPSRRSP